MLLLVGCIGSSGIPSFPCWRRVCCLPASRRLRPSPARPRPLQRGLCRYAQDTQRVRVPCRCIAGRTYPKAAGIMPLPAFLGPGIEQAVAIAHLAQHKEGRDTQSCNRPDGRRALFPIFENQMGFILNIVCPQKLSDTCFGAGCPPDNHRFSRFSVHFTYSGTLKVAFFVPPLFLPKNPARFFFPKINILFFQKITVSAVRCIGCRRHISSRFSCGLSRFCAARHNISATAFL